MRILWLTSDLESADLVSLKNKFNITVSNFFEDINESFEVVVASNYDKIIPEKYFDIPLYGVVIIHSSDLPIGRGWAPIYNSIQKGDEDYVVSLIKVDKSVDAGNILLKIRVKKPRYINNDNLRKIDEEMTVVLVEKFITILKDKNNVDLTGEVQNHNLVSYYKKRKSNSNKLNPRGSLEKQILDILATNKDYASFIEIDGEVIEILASNKKTYTLVELGYKFEVFIK